MEWVVLALLAAAVVAGTVLVATGRLEPDPLSEPTSTRPPLALPDEPGSEDVDRLRLGTAVYGYAVDDVDAALEARRTRLAEQEREFAERERELAEQKRKERVGRVHPDA
ncbi:hypothetical protein N798_06430 [Knoellia flava TL1]|uniref:Cell division protein DivIVA n=1 Tax=Knoellia flava TL1 TaxID=1385518 RepID=A0ABR4XFN0_9MICO|nr:hypothetical protein [Knoellia flava]KGN33597.1 hypothetical protein N798_06430 [Knoellia flava TL1]